MTLESRPLMDVEPNGHVNVWSLADGTAVCSVRGSDGAVVTVMLRAGELEVRLLYGGKEWQQTFMYRGGHNGVSNGVVEPMMLQRQAEGRPERRNRKKVVMTVDQLTGGSA